MGSLTGGSAEEAALSSLPEATGLRVGVAAVSLLPPFQFRARPGPKFPRFHHFRGLKKQSGPLRELLQAALSLRSDVTGPLTCPGCMSEMYMVLFCR